MAKRGKKEKSGGEWLESVTKDQADFHPWKQWKYHPRSPGRRGRKSKVQGDRGTGMISLFFGIILLVLTLVGAIMSFSNGEKTMSVLIILGGGSAAFIFIKAAYDHIRYSSE